MTTAANTLRMDGVADVLGSAFLQSASSTSLPGLIARWKTYRAERRQLREFIEASAEARGYAESLPSLAAELQAIIGRDHD